MTCIATPGRDGHHALYISPKLRAAIFQEALALSLEYESTTDPARRARLVRQSEALNELLALPEPERWGAGR
jgi:hypothetical protein